MVRVFVTTDGGTSFAGPMEEMVVYAGLQDGSIPPDARWLKATGQSFGDLQAQVGLESQPMSALGEGFARMAESKSRSSGVALPQASAPPPLAESGPDVLRVLGTVWFIAGLVGGVYIWITFGRVTSPYGSYTSGNPAGIAVAIGTMAQGLLVLMVCLELAKVSDRVRALWSDGKPR